MAFDKKNALTLLNNYKHNIFSIINELLTQINN